MTPVWLVSRPIAHRGLHDRTVGVVENSAAAARAAIAGDFAIECDVQLTRDGEAIVFHDFTLDRLTHATGAVCDHTAAELQSMAYKVGQDRIMTLTAFLALINGSVPLICEIKSRFDGDTRLCDRTAALARGYGGPIAIKSFDPAIVTRLRADPPCSLGIVAEASYDDPEWDELPAVLKRDLAEMLHFADTRPDFLSYHVNDLPHGVPHLCRVGLGMPVMAWTVRRADQRAIAAAWSDQMVFEGFLP